MKRGIVSDETWYYQFCHENRKLSIHLSLNVSTKIRMCYLGIIQIFQDVSYFINVKSLFRLKMRSATWTRFPIKNLLE